MDESNASQPIRLGSRSVRGNALPFSVGMQVTIAALSDSALGVTNSREHVVFLSTMRSLGSSPLSSSVALSCASS